jgi:hypothetical protein
MSRVKLVNCAGIPAHDSILTAGRYVGAAPEEEGISEATAAALAAGLWRPVFEQVLPWRSRWLVSPIAE